MMMITRSVRTHRAAIGCSMASARRLASLLLVVLALVFTAVASAQTAHYSGSQYTTAVRLKVEQNQLVAGIV